jgi:hypothetical protein
MFNPRILKKFYEVYAEICVEGKEIKGLMAIDWLRMEIKNNERQENVKVAYDIDRNVVHTTIIEA